MIDPYVARSVKLEDKDRFLTALFAPAETRADLLTLYAFNIEIARIRESVREPLLGNMKVQWWRDRIAGIYEGGGVPKGNPVLEALGDMVSRRNLSRVHFDALLDARARDLDDAPPRDVLDLEDYAEGTSARLTWLALEVLGARSEAATVAGRHVGIAWSLTGILRAVLFYARSNRFMLPTDMMELAGLTGHDLQERKNAAKIADIAADIAKQAELHLNRAREQANKVERAALPALLPATLASSYLRRLAKRKFDLFDPRHALQRPDVVGLIWNGLRGVY